jgi:N-acetylneuraminate synthase
MNIKIDNYEIGSQRPVFFVADVAANHDGDLSRAKDLIWMCAEAGADCAKFQHFNADTIVSDFGFKHLGTQQSHQNSWKKSVYDVYRDASLNQDWTCELKETCDKAGIVFMTSPYSMELVDYVDSFVSAYKIGSGDITWTGIIEHIAQKNKPVLLATGASSLDDVDRAMGILNHWNSSVILMQCNTNYTGLLENFKYINLNVLKAYSELYPSAVLGLSDHTPGCATVLGSVALGARVIEKHFTDSCDREGPDHKFSMDPSSWREMVERTRELEYAMGENLKKVENNEKETVVIQRRALRASRDLQTNESIKSNDVFPLRPCPKDAVQPYELPDILNRKLSKPVRRGDIIKWNDLI